MREGLAVIPKTGMRQIDKGVALLLTNIGRNVFGLMQLYMHIWLAGRGLV